MGKKQLKEDDMLPLNVDLAPMLLARLKLAKAVLNTPIRTIAAQAFDAWLREHGITEEKVRKMSK